jgi:ABC-2 type transport system ATP-binding protein
MNAIQVSHVAKRFGQTQAVADVSFDVGRGELFGLLGPNGAGKTTTIRLILDIFEPDRGTVSILGGPMDEDKKDRIGYMPEERGLYQDATLERCLLYLASLKSVPAAEARRRLGEYLERFDLAAHKGKKVKELSKGMQQKAQIINTVLHQPELIIIDEPFAALDPINTRLVKDLIRDLGSQGTTIVMSTHQMHQVEELCDRILLIDQGRDLLFGKVEEPELQGIEQIVPHNSSTKLTLADGTSPQDVLRSLLAHQTPVERFEIATPTLEEIFVRVVGQGDL